MLKLYLLRHAEAEASASEGDQKRRLTKKGERDALQFGDYCLKAGFFPREALVSTALRARETFEALIRHFPQKPRVMFEPALYNAAADTLYSLIQTTDANIMSLLIVGHNPGIAELALFLADDYASDRASLENMRRHFPPPALAVIAFDCTSWAEITPGRGDLQCFLTFPASHAGRRF